VKTTNPDGEPKLINESEAMAQVDGNNILGKRICWIKAKNIKLYEKAW
jgi:hypothetical protein